MLAHNASNFISFKLSKHLHPWTIYDRQSYSSLEVVELHKPYTFIDMVPNKIVHLEIQISSEDHSAILGNSRLEYIQLNSETVPETGCSPYSIPQVTIGTGCTMYNTTKVLRTPQFNPEPRG